MCVVADRATSYRDVVKNRARGVLHESPKRGFVTTFASGSPR
jgi:hypothetical protein